eukprot:scaffold419207_cov30-Attheya_sp.AAC.1
MTMTHHPPVDNAMVPPVARTVSERGEHQDNVSGSSGTGSSVMVTTQPSKKRRRPIDAPKSIQRPGLGGASHMAVGGEQREDVSAAGTTPNKSTSKKPLAKKKAIAVGSSRRVEEDAPPGGADKTATEEKEADEQGEIGEGGDEGNKEDGEDENSNRLGPLVEVVNGEIRIQESSMVVQGRRSTSEVDAELGRV